MDLSGSVCYRSGYMIKRILYRNLLFIKWSKMKKSVISFFFFFISILIVGRTENTVLRQCLISFERSCQLYTPSTEKSLWTWYFHWMRGRPRLRCPHVILELNDLYARVTSYLRTTCSNQRIRRISMSS